MAGPSSPLPDKKLEIVGLSQLAHIVEDGAEAIYGRRIADPKEIKTIIYGFARLFPKVRITPQPQSIRRCLT